MVPGPPALVMIRTRSPLGQGLHGKGRGVIEKGLEGVRPDHARAFEGRAISGVRPGQHAGMAGRRLLACLTGPGFQDNDRFFRAGGVGNLDKLVAGDDILQIADDDLGLRVTGKIGQQVVFIDICLVADADKLGEAEMAAGGQVEDRGTQGPGLGHDRNAAGTGQVACKGAV